MNKNKILILLFNRLFLYFLKYLSSFFLTLLLCEMFIVIELLTINSNLEKVVFLILKNTPFQNSFGKDIFTLEAKDVVSFVSFWSLLTFIMTAIADKLFHPKLRVNSNLIFFIITTLLHFSTIIRFPQNLFPVIIVFYISSIVMWFFYQSFKKWTVFINSVFQKIQQT